ncbi:AsmA family protein [Novacetimonas hansenii]|uniref:AsmA family protein n=1 Tax=Novacetimonas hansenii TaxID=436 RepID=UPI000789B009|nr:AsmA family protein [Novacetimonas hansenii]RFP04534.1 membrane assembly protein AsmA [Novacetimonas hansenii]WEQ60167.1 AsmA family protein [Novacetimonas hansenii]CUW46484.1 putative assembly protein [Novacetimonas hansenii]
MANSANLRRGLLVSAAAIIVVAGGGALALRSILDPQALRARAIAAIERQTGREVTLGAMEVHVFPAAISVHDIALADMKGGDGTPMFSARAMDASVGLMALLHHRIQLDNITLDHPVLHLRRDADGQANWRMTPNRAQAADATPAPVRPVAPAAGNPWSVQLGSLRVSDATVGWDDRLSGMKTQLALGHVRVDGLNGARPTFDVAGTRDGAAFTLSGHTGAISLTHVGQDAKWPVHFELAFADHQQPAGHLTVDGTVADPDRARGYDLKLDGTLSRLVDLAPWVGGYDLPDARDVALSLRIVDSSTPADTNIVPLVQSLHLRTGAFDAGHYLTGLRVGSLSVDAAGPKETLAVAGAGNWNGQDLKLAASFGSLEQAEHAVLTHLSDSLPMSVDLSGAAGSLRVAGMLGGSRAVVNVTASAGHLALPNGAALDHLEATTHLVSEGNGARFALSDLNIRSTQLALTGTLDMSVHGGHGGVPLVSGAVEASWLDLDALRGGNATAKAAPATSGGKPGDDRIAFERLRDMDMDVRFNVTQMELAGDVYRQALMHVALREGRLGIDPLQATGTGRRVSGRLSVDASGDMPVVSGTIGTLVLPATWIEQHAGMPMAVQGAFQLVGEATARGHTATELRNTLDGHMGASLVNGTIDGAALGSLLGQAARGLTGSGSIPLRCFGMHMAMANGRANVDTLGLQTSVLSMTGQGSVGLASYALDLRLVPQVMIGGTGASVPVRVGGTLSAPRPRMDAGADGRYAIGLLLGDSSGKSTVPDLCPATLKAAREGQAGPEPTGAAPQPTGNVGSLVRANPKAAQKIDKAKNLLKGLGLIH